MKIVVLDADPAFGCDAAFPEARRTLDTAALGELGELEVHPRTAPSDVLDRCRGAQVILTNKVILGKEQMAELPDLKLISVLATGVNVIDLEAAKARGITVCNVPGYSTMSTAQHTFALLLELSNRVGLHASEVASGSWETSKSFSFYRTPLRELDGQVIGVVGYGAIGKQVVKMAQAFGMQVLVHTRTERKVEGVLFVDKETLLRQSDVISLHCPLTEETHHFIDDVALALMKPSAFLLNGARGPVVDEAALAKAIIEGRIGGVGTDVLTTEPARTDCPLLQEAVKKTGRCLITPHIAWATEAARQRLLAISVENVIAFQNGTPQNVVG